MIQKIRVRLQNAVVTGRGLYIDGSITIGEELLEECGIEEGEVVDISNSQHTEWTQGFVAKGKGREIVVNGSPARMFFIGDKISIIAYGYRFRYDGDLLKNDFDTITINLDGTIDNDTVTK
jgi:aspartate 1-decarboxylase